MAIRKCWEFITLHIMGRQHRFRNQSKRLFQEIQHQKLNIQLYYIMPPKESQKQKQKQTVIVNIGDKLLVKKRKRKPRKKAAPRAPPRAPPPAPFPPQDFARVIFQPQPPLRPDENLAVQLNSVTKQLNDLQEKQKHRTGNLMAGQKAMERESQQLGDPEPEPEPAAAPAPASPAKKKGRRTKQEVLEAEAMGFEDKTKRPYVKKQTRAEQAAEILLQQSGVMGGGRQPSLADFNRGSSMSSITMTPGLQTPASEPVKKRLVIRDPMPTPTPDTSSISEASFGGASAATEPRF
jgi:type IV secretory pathway VirB10-like protein